MEAESEKVRRGRLGRVEVADLVVAFPHDVVVGDDDAGDRREEDGVCAEVGCKIVGSR